jgi:AraC-like DNA-binding protein
MLSDAMDASAAAYHVGYMSRSQFTREYSRLFGVPPLWDVEQIRQQPQPAELRSRIWIDGLLSIRTT